MNTTAASRELQTGLRMTYTDVMNRATSVRILGINITSNRILKSGTITAYRVRPDRETKQSVMLVTGEELNRARFPATATKITLPGQSQSQGLSSSAHSYPKFSLYIGLANETRVWSSVDSVKIVITFNCEDSQGFQSTQNLIEMIECPVKPSGPTSISSRVPSTTATTATTANTGNTSALSSILQKTMQKDPKTSNHKELCEAEITKKRALAAGILASFSDSDQDEDETETEDDQEAKIEQPKKRAKSYEDPVSQLPVLSRPFSASLFLPSTSPGVRVAPVVRVSPVVAVPPIAPVVRIAPVAAVAPALPDALEEQFLTDLVQQGRLNTDHPIAANSSTSVPAFEDVSCNRNLLLSALKIRESMTQTQITIQNLKAQLAQANSDFFRKQEEQIAILANIKRVRSVWQGLVDAYKDVPKTDATS